MKLLRNLLKLMRYLLKLPTKALEQQVYSLELQGKFDIFWIPDDSKMEACIGLLGAQYDQSRIFDIRLKPKFSS